MQNNWWKILTCILLIYTVIVGLATPLEPGIKKVSSLIIPSPNSAVTVYGYNTNFLDKKHSIYLRNDNSKQIVCCNITKIKSDTELEFIAQFPSKVNDPLFRLFISNEEDGTMEYAGMSLKNVEVDANHQEESDCEDFVVHKRTGFSFPYVNNLYESIRNLMFHVPMWFAMIIIMLISAICGIIYLIGGKIKFDILSESAIHVGLLFAFLGLATGSLWAKFTWSEHTELLSFKGWWVDDPKLNGSAIATLIYFAYYILKRSINDREKAARIAAVYNIFAFVMFFVLIMVYPRIKGGLHPGMDGNPAFSSYDLNNNLRLVFYPACIGFILLSVWIWQLRSSFSLLKYKHENEN